MYYGSDDVRKNIRGTFLKFFYKCTIVKTKNNKHLINFGRKDKLVSYSFCYVRNKNDMYRLIDMWNNSGYASHKYELLKQSKIKLRPKSLSINEVVEDFNKIHKFKQVVTYIEQNNVEIIC